MLTKAKNGLGPLTLVLGGARSGKSRLAQALVLRSGLRPVLIAPAEALDDEMSSRIAAHRAERGGLGWRVVEAPRDVASALRTAARGEAVLLDCATLWLSNALTAGADLAAEEAALMAGLSACPAPVVVVSNEVGLGIVPDTALGRAFRDAQGRLNQRLASQAGCVLLVAAGLPLVLKGRLP